MKNLLIDIGNSNIKAALSSGNKINNIERLNYTNKNFEESFNSILKYKRKDFNSVGISCLDKKKYKTIIQVIKRKYPVQPFFIIYNNKLPIKIDYEKSLGTDRICSAVAAALEYKNKKNILIIDFGTATTYNLVTNRLFIGGLISPGILTSLQSLNKKANLPNVKLSNIKKLISNRTEKNILSGVIHQSLFTTESIIMNLKKEYNDLFVICTGGLAELIFKKSCLINKLDKYLVLKGINIILNYNQKNI